VPATRPATDYTARVIPHRDGVRFRWKPRQSCGSDDSVKRRAKAYSAQAELLALLSRQKQA
jgi:hypothetical protein